MSKTTTLNRRPFLLGAGAASLLAVSSSASLAQGRPSGLSLPVIGSTAAGDLVTGTFTPIAAIVQGTTLLLQGLLNIAGGPTRRVQLPVDQVASTATCTILDLRTGEITLNVLGLVITLSPLRLLIEANPALGLLGQLLCAIANLLKGVNLTQLANLLNQLLGLFR